MKKEAMMMKKNIMDEKEYDEKEDDEKGDNERRKRRKRNLNDSNKVIFDVLLDSEGIDILPGEAPPLVPLCYFFIFRGILWHKNIRPFLL